MDNKKKDDNLKISKANFVSYKKNLNITSEYTIGQNLGSGSFGTVRRAVHKKSNQVRAIKILKKSEQDQEKLFLEVDILSKLSHPNIMQIFEFYDDAINFYIVSNFDKEANKPKKLPEFLASGRIPTWISRIQTFLYSTKDDDGEKTYQINQAKIAIANGGLLGLGPGNSVQRNFLPHCYSDFIYALIIEEYGLVGAAIILIIYLIFLFRCIRLYRKCPFAFGAFLALALSFTLVIQAITNMGVNVTLFPNTGVTLPLISMGGSSFFFTCFSIGIILSVARNVEQLEGSQLKKIEEQVSAENDVSTEEK